MQQVELTAFEKFFFYGIPAGDEIVNGIVITNKISEKLGDDHVKRAMHYMYLRHPLFRAHVSHDLKMEKIYFEIPTEKTDYFTVNDMKFEKLKLISRDDLINDIEKCSSKSFAYGKKDLLWRLKLFEFEENNETKYSFLLLVPMFMTDGINLATLCVEFVNILNCLLTDKECNEMKETLELIDSMESIIENKNLITQKFREDFEKYRKNEPKVYFKLPAKLMNFDDFGYKINLLKFDKDETKKLISSAKSNNTKVNGLLASAIFYALKDLYEENGLLMPKDVNLVMPINLRFRVNPNIEFSHCRAMVTGITLNFIYPKFGKYENILNDAKYIDELLYQKIECGELYDFLLENDSDKNITDLSTLAAVLDSQRDYDIVFSNTGTYVSDRKKVVDGPIKIEELYYGDSLTSFPTIYAPLYIHANTFNGQLMIQISSNRRYLGAQKMDSFKCLFEKHLRNVFN